MAFSRLLFKKTKQNQLVLPFALKSLLPNSPYACLLSHSVVSDSLDCSPPGSSVHFSGIFSGKSTGVGCYFLPPEDLSDPGITLAFPMSPTLQADFLSTEPPGKPHGQYSYSLLRSWFRTSPVVQWLKTHLPMQGAQVQSLLQEVSTCHGSTKPMCHNYWAQAWGPTSHNYPTKEATAMRNLCTATRVSSVTQSCPTLCDPMDCSTPGFPVHHRLP